MPRPLHQRPGALVAVLCGGMLGTAARAGLAAALPASVGGPMGLLVANVVGAFALGLLLEALARRGPESPRQQTLRLLAGTGILGGFTSYSALAVAVAGPAGEPRLDAAALAYGLVTVVLGLLAAALGILLAAAQHRRLARATTGGDDAAQDDTGYDDTAHDDTGYDNTAQDDTEEMAP